MECDWEVELGADAPVIDAGWPGWVDLRTNPERVAELPEAADFPALATALLALNAPASPLWTAKCDLWPIDDPGEVDTDELAAAPGDCLAALACYIDCLPLANGLFPTPAVGEAWLRAAVAGLGRIDAPDARADLVLRRAVTATEEGFGVTAYLTACGRTESAARESLQRALAAFAQMAVATPPPAGSLSKALSGYNEFVGE